MTLPGDDKPEGWESLAEEESAGSLAPNPELEEALREAAEAVDSHQKPEPEAEPPAGGAGEAEEGVDPVKAGMESDDLEVVRAGLKRSQDRWIRLQADFENFRRRTQKERQEAYRYGSENLVKDLLTTVDNLERAIEHSRKSDGGDLQGLLQGVELVWQEFLGILERHHVTEVEAEGKPFDPKVHEAMAQIPDGSVPPNTVLEVLQKGFQLRDRLIRPARVVVARSAEGGEGGSGEGGAPD